MELASPHEELAQRFDVLVNTRVGTNILDISYGIDYDWIRANAGNSDPEQAFLTELITRIDKKVEPLIGSFDVLSINMVRNVLNINMILYGTNGIKSEARLSIQ